MPRSELCPHLPSSKLPSRQQNERRPAKSISLVLVLADHTHKRHLPAKHNHAAIDLQARIRAIPFRNERSGKRITDQRREGDDGEEGTGAYANHANVRDLGYEGPGQRDEAVKHIEH